MAPFKDEHLYVAPTECAFRITNTRDRLIIAPGSQTTLAQSGLPEGFTPPRVRIRSRMFPTDEPGKYEPYKIRPKRKQQLQTNGQQDAAGEDAAAEVEMLEEEITLEEDPMSEDGAIWPMQGGRIVDWPCFFALMQHLYNMLNGGFHTPILLVAQPAWTPVEHIRITRFFFEKFKCPAFALMDSAQAMCYAYGIPSACVIDIGKDKADITAVNEFLTSTTSRGIAVPNLGGEAMTQNLLEQLKGDGFDREMCEQLKISPVCEILPAEIPIPGSKEALAQQQKRQQATSKKGDKAANPASSASTGADGSGPGQRHTAGATGDAPRGPGIDEQGRVTEVGGEEDAGEEGLDVASIVAGGKTNEFVARKEKEKQEKAAAAAARKKGADAASAAPKSARLKNSEREFNSFMFDDKAARERAKDDEVNGSAMPPKPAQPALPPPAAASTGAPAAQPPLPTLDTAMTNAPPPAAPASATSLLPPPSATAGDPTSPTAQTPTVKDRPPANPYTRIVTVGPARFRPLPEEYLPTLTSAIYAAIQAVPNPTSRQTIWEHMLITGQGARVRGLKEALLAALQARFVVSPSSASIFTSEPPSSFGTPTGTGTSTPLPPGQSALPSFNGGAYTPTPPGHAQPGQQPGGVNPLLYAATTAHAAAGQPGSFARPPSGIPGMPPSTPGGAGTPLAARGTPQPGQPAYRGGTPVASRPGGAPPQVGGTSQTPTAVRAGKLPEYFGEWKDANAEFGVVFLGAQVAAKVVFLADVQVCL